MENLPQEHQGLVFVKAEPPPQVCSSRMTDAILKKNKTLFLPLSDRFLSNFFWAHCTQTQEKNPNTSIILSCTMKSRGFPGNRKPRTVHIPTEASGQLGYTQLRGSDLSTGDGAGEKKPWVKSQLV